MPRYTKVISVICTALVILYTCERIQKDKEEKRQYEFDQMMDYCIDTLQQEYEEQRNPRANDSEFIRYKCYYEVEHGNYAFDDPVY